MGEQKPSDQTNTAGKCRDQLGESYATKPARHFPQTQNGTGSSGCFPRRPSRPRYLHANQKGAEEENEAEEEKVSEAWTRNPHDPLPEDQAAQPLVEVAEILETETAQTFEAALRYDAAHGAGHPGLAHFYSMERV